MTLAQLLTRFRHSIAGDRHPERSAPKRAWGTRQGCALAKAVDLSALPSARLQPTSHAQEDPDRYLAVRFPGAPHTVDELRDSATVIKAARLYFEDEDLDRAASCSSSRQTPTRRTSRPGSPPRDAIPQRKAPAFTRLAKRFHEHFPNSGRWSEILRLGLRLARRNRPSSTPIRASRHRRTLRRVPQVQNWIQAPFDLTGDVLAAEFHAKMRGGDSRSHLRESERNVTHQPGRLAERTIRPSEALARATDRGAQNWNKVIASLRTQAKTADPFLFSTSCWSTCAASRRPRSVVREILGTSSCGRQRARLRAVGEGGFHVLARTRPRRFTAPPPRRALSSSEGELAALALTSYGNAIKWSEISSTGSDRCRSSRSAGCRKAWSARPSAATASVPRDNYAALPPWTRSSSARCSRGHLPRQPEPRQVEIVDAGCGNGAATTCSRIRTRCGAGARSGRQRGLRPRNGEPRGRATCPREARDHIRMVVDAFRRGEIYPATGSRSTSRRGARGGARFPAALPRFGALSARRSRTRPRREAGSLVGLREVMANLLAATRPLGPGQPQGCAKPAGQQLSSIDTMYDISRRTCACWTRARTAGRGVRRRSLARWWWHDHHAAPDESSPPALCEVMRRS